MSAYKEMAEARANALLKEAEITGEQKRSAAVTLAGLALAAADGDERASDVMLREALEITGLTAHEPGKRRKPPAGCARVVVSYQRPGRTN